MYSNQNIILIRFLSINFERIKRKHEFKSNKSYNKRLNIKKEKK
jgi:hypothetical protein